MENSETCIVEVLKEGNLEDIQLTSEDQSVQLTMRASYLEWSEKQKVVLFYGVKK